MTPTLILLHLPKTGGASVRDVALRNYRPEHRIHVPGGSSRDERAWFALQSPERRARARIVTGHLRYGLDTMLPHPAEYSTCIRHPVDRIRSLFRWLSDNPRPATDPFIADGFEAFALGDGLADVDNGQTRMLAAVHHVAGQRLGERVTKRELLTAVRHLEQMPVVGTTDDLDGYIDRLAARYGWEHTDLPVIHRSFTPLGPDPELDDKILRRNQHDYALYQIARRSS